MRIPLLVVLSLGSLLVGANPSGSVLLGDQEPEEQTETGARPYDLQVPKAYDDSEPTPLVVLLHGYTSNGAEQKAYFRLGPLAERENFLLAAPDGTRNVYGARFWNATDACCNFFASDVDDVAYLDALISEISENYNVDDRRVFLIGHSNGGFMAHRFACDRPDRVAAIVSLAGQQWADPERCRASSAVSVLHVHGTEDDTIEYEGGSTPGGPYPGAEATVATWADKNDCSGPLAPAGPDLDIDTGLPGAETSVAAYPDCPDGGAIELWTINGGEHVPSLDDAWGAATWAFMAAHARATRS